MLKHPGLGSLQWLHQSLRSGLPRDWPQVQPLQLIQHSIDVAACRFIRKQFSVDNRLIWKQLVERRYRAGVSAVLCNQCQNHTHRRRRSIVSRHRPSSVSSTLGPLPLYHSTKIQFISWISATSVLLPQDDSRCHDRPDACLAYMYNNTTGLCITVGEAQNVILFRSLILKIL